MTLSSVLVAYCSEVFSIGLNCGSPSYATLTFFSASALLITAVVGICASITASAAWTVPGTDASTAAFFEFGGILAKSGGRSFPAYVHGPSADWLRNQRPDSST